MQWTIIAIECLCPRSKLQLARRFYRTGLCRAFLRIVLGRVTKENCTRSDSIFIEATSVEADFGHEVIPCTGQLQFINLSSDTTNSHWDFGDGTTSTENKPVHAYKANEKYTVVLIANLHSICPDTLQ